MPHKEPWWDRECRDCPARVPGCIEQARLYRRGRNPAIVPQSATRTDWARPSSPAPEMGRKRKGKNRRMNAPQIEWSRPRRAIMPSFQTRLDPPAQPHWGCGHRDARNCPESMASPESCVESGNRVQHSLVWNENYLRKNCGSYDDYRTFLRRIKNNWQTSGRQPPISAYAASRMEHRAQQSLENTSPASTRARAITHVSPTTGVLRGFLAR